MEVFFQDAFGLDWKKMKVGEFIYVGEANIGIRGFNTETNTEEFNRVLYVVRKQQRNVIEAISSNTITRVSPAHKFYLPRERVWESAKKLALRGSADLLSPEGPISVIFRASKEKTPFLDIQVETSENYFSNGLLSHNSNGYGPDYKCVSPSCEIEISNSRVSMQELFQKLGYDYTTMDYNRSYDVSSKKFTIKSYNEKTQQFEQSIILSIIRKPAEPLYLLQTVDNAFPFECSGGHYVLTKDGYEAVRDLPNTFELLREKGWTPYKKILLDKTSDLLDLEVENNCNYLSAGAVSHNTTGGRAIKFYASNRSRVQRVDYIKEKGIITGIQMRVKNEKNKAGIPYREAQLTLDFEKGFDINNEYMDFIISLGIAEQKGAWFYMPQYGLEKANGRDAVQDWLNHHPDEYAKVKLEVNTQLTGETVLDQDNAPVADDDFEEPPEIIPDQV